MHFYQNKHGGLVALLVLLLTQVHIPFQKNQLFKVVCSKGWPLCPQDIRPKAEQPFHSSRRGERRVVLPEVVEPSTSLLEREMVAGNADFTFHQILVPACIGSLNLLLGATLSFHFNPISHVHVHKGVSLVFALQLPHFNSIQNRVHLIQNFFDDPLSDDFFLVWVDVANNTQLEMWTPNNAEKTTRKNDQLWQLIAARPVNINNGSQRCQIAIYMKSSIKEMTTFYHICVAYNLNSPKVFFRRNAP